jgi:hypothetical protein
VVDFHAIQGGFQMGVDFEILLSFTLTLDLIFFRRTLVNSYANIDIDVIQLAIDLIKYLLGGGGGGQDEGNPNDIELSTFVANNDGSVENEDDGMGAGDNPGGEGGKGVKPEFTGAGMFDYVQRPFLPTAGHVVNGPPETMLEPNLGYGFNLIPLFAEVPFLDILYAIDKGLEATGGGLSIGPGVSVGLPTTVSLNGATISNHPFDVTQATPGTGTSDQKATFKLAERTPIDPHLQPLSNRPDEIGLLLEHHVGFDVGIYFYFEIAFFKVIHIGAQTGSFPIFYTGSLPGNAGGPWENQLSFLPGGGPVPFGPPTTAPTVGPYTANQPQGRWKNGILAQYGVSFFNAKYETPIGTFSALDQQDRFFAFPQLSNIPIGPVVAGDDAIQGRNIYRLFNDGSPVELVGTINDNTTTTFHDTKP